MKRAKETAMKTNQTKMMMKNPKKMTQKMKKSFGENSTRSSKKEH